MKTRYDSNRQRAGITETNMSPYSCVQPERGVIPAPERSSKGFCVSWGCLDDLDSLTKPAQGPSWVTGFGVTESPGRCGTQPRKRILSADSCRLICADAPMPWLRKAENAKQTLCRVGFALPLNRSPESKHESIQRYSTPNY